MNRREMLAALGLTTGSLFLPSLARAGATPPTRLLLFYSAQGCVPHRWRCAPGNRPLEKDWVADWTAWAPEDFSDSLRPLHAWRHQVSAIGGLSLVSAEADGDGVRHERAQAHSLTGADAAWINGFPYAGDMTFDQRIANVIARSDRYRSLEVSVDGGLAYDGYGSVIYRGPNQPVPVIDDPAELWDRLFGATGATGDPVVANQGSVLDAVADRYATLAPRLGTEDRRKLDVHRDLVRQLEVRVQGLVDPQCGATPERHPSLRNYDEDFDHHADLLVAALACDLTRVGSFQMGQLTTEQLDLPPGDIHAEYAHEIYSGQAGEDAMTNYIAYHAERHFTQLLAKLDAVPEGDGTLLDHTLVVWMSEMADSWHGFDQYPVVYAGGGGVLPLGRYVNYARTVPFAGLSPREERVMGIPHQRFLLSVLGAMGAPTTSLGVSTVRGLEGSLIDCTGTLKELNA